MKFHSVGMVAGPVIPLELYVNDNGSGEDDELMGDERIPMLMFMPIFIAN